MGRIWQVLFGGRLVSVGVLLCALVAGGCSSGQTNGTGSFLGRASNAAVFIQWTRTGSSLTGSVQETILRRPTGAGVKSSQAPFTGTISGNGLTLQLSRGETLVGHLEGSGFMLTYPGAEHALITVNFSPAAVSEYNEAV